MACLLGLSLLSSDSAFFSDTRQRKIQNNERLKGKAVISQAIAADGVGRTLFLFLCCCCCCCCWCVRMFLTSSHSRLLPSSFARFTCCLPAPLAPSQKQVRDTHTNICARYHPLFFSSHFSFLHARPLLSRFLTVFCPQFSLPPSLPPSRQPTKTKTLTRIMVQKCYFCRCFSSSFSLLSSITSIRPPLPITSIRPPLPPSFRSYLPPLPPSFPSGQQKRLPPL